jgi:hypothetical protein
VKVVVSGASGLIGSALVPALASAGHEVVVLVRRPASGPGEISWDPAGGVIGPPGLDGVDGVVNLSGTGIADKKWTEERKREILQSRLDSTRLLARTLIALDPRPQVFCSGSAVGWYGDAGPAARTEEDPAGPGFLAEVVRQWEEAAQPAAEAGIRTVMLRTGVVLSAKGGALAKQLPLFKLGLGGRLGRGDQYLAWVSIDDEVGAIVHCLTHDDISGPVNVCAPAPVTNAEFTATLGKVLHRPTALPVPLVGPRLLFGREVVDEMFLAGQRVLPARLQGSGYKFLTPDLESALRRVLDKPA